MTSFGEDVTIPPNPVGFVKDTIDQGLSGRAGLAAFREAGGQIRDAFWYDLRGQVVDALARSPLASALDPFALPDETAYATWSMGAGGEYATQVRVLFRDIDSGVIGVKDYTYKSAAPHTPAEAMAAAQLQYGDESALDQYHQQLYGTMVANVYQTVPYGG